MHINEWCTGVSHTTIKGSYAVPTLHLGVIDLPYAHVPSYRKVGLKKPRKVASGTQTTGDVAGFLETRYHVMEVFFHQHEKEIAGSVEKSVSNAIDALILGAPPTLNVFGSATSDIEDRFKQFISNREMEVLGYPGVPTAAALAGVSHRFKHPYQKRPRRPSFIDTGLYMSSMRAWID